MKLFSPRSIASMLLGIATGLALFDLVSKSPYFFAIGLVVGVYLARPTTRLSGSVYGVIIALALGVYLIIIQAFQGWVALTILLLVTFGGGYGFFLVWARERWQSYEPFYF